MNCDLNPDSRALKLSTYTLSKAISIIGIHCKFWSVIRLCAHKYTFISSTLYTVFLS